MLDWTAAEAEFYRDGSLRDVYVLDTSLDDWQRALDSLRASPFDLAYTRDGRETPLPSRASDALRADGRVERQLRVGLVGPTAVSHFFTESEIEFDLDPREVTGPAHLDAVLKFMKRLASATGKDAILTPENEREIVIFRVPPGDGAVRHRPFGGHGPSAPGGA